MKPFEKMTSLALIATVAISLAAPTSALADQSSKNQWRDIGIAGAALGVYGLATHNSTLGIIGLAGAGYSANRYEQDRKHQSQQSSERHFHRNENRRYYYDHGHRYYQDANTGERCEIYQVFGNVALSRLKSTRRG